MEMTYIRIGLKKIEDIIQKCKTKGSISERVCFSRDTTFLTMALSRETTTKYINESTLDFINSYMNAMCLQTKVPVYLLTQPSFYETLHILEN